MSEELKTLTNKRGLIKAALKRFSNYVNSFTPDKTVIELNTRLERADYLLSEFDQIQSQIELIENNDSQLEERVKFEDSFYSIIAKAKQLSLDNANSVRPAANSLNTSVNTDSHSVIHSNVRLPTISLPEYSGSFDSWLQFFDTFSSLIDNNNSLSTIQKFYYLKSCLKGEASKVIFALEVTESNYAIAWQLLKERFENKRIITHSHVKALFELPVITRENSRALRNLLDEFLRHTRSLKSLGESVHTWDTLLVYLVVSKLDTSTQREWEAFICDKKIVTVDMLTTFLANKYQLLETINKNSENRSHFKYEKSSSHLSTNKFSCPLCKEKHFIYSCERFIKLSANSRLDEVKRLHLCINCLKPNHFSAECKSTFSCKTCSKRHNTLLHLETNENTNQTNKQGFNLSNNNNNNNNFKAQDLKLVSNNTNGTENSITTHCKPPNSSVVLSTAIIYVHNIQGKRIKCRCLLDSGSQSNFITTDLFNKLALHSTNINHCVTGINQSSTFIGKGTKATIESLHCNYKRVLPFLIINKITDNVPSSSFSIDHLNIPSDIKLADPDLNKTNQIDMLIGAGIYFELLCIGQIKLGKNQPLLQKTKLGWLIGGPLQFTGNFRNNSQSSCHVSTNSELHNKLEQFWKIEEFVDAPTKLSQDEIQCENDFIKNYSKNENGHFVVHLPMREDKELGESLDQAVSRFHKLESKFKNNPEFKEKYVSFINEYIELGHMSEVCNSVDTNTNQIYYLPHHGVLKDSSLTTKLRVVFDASCKTSNGRSLNNILLVGPTIQHDLFSIILRFRKHNYVLTADIAKMYRQIEVVENQRDLQRIVWRNNPDVPLRHYRLNTVTYGTGPASYLAIRCLHQAAYDYKSKFSLSSQIIIDDFYVDDLITGSDSIQGAIQIKNEVSEILSSAGFQLRQWRSNKPGLLMNSKTDDNSNISQYVISDNEITKTLGILWDPHSDSFQFSINKGIHKPNDRVTKRSILSIISQIFDPLGVISPITIRAKVILQHLWQLKVDWDEPVPAHIYEEWMRFYTQIISVTQLQIPRHVLLQNYVHTEIHAFGDASQIAFGSCLYMRSEDSLGNINTELLCAKSRVAPLKSVTLPRLELCAALLAAQLMRKVVQDLKFQIFRRYFWTDSTIVLSWLNSEPSRWQTFVSNRVSEIQRLTKKDEWNHVTSSDNPADLISRGVSPDAIINNSLWFKGPSWLSRSSECWVRSGFKIDLDLPEKRKLKSSQTFLNTFDIDIFDKFSSLNKLQRVLAYCLRFINNMRSSKSKVTGILSVDELNNSLSLLIKLAQSQGFVDDLRSLQKKGIVSNQSKLISLNPFVDNSGIIRVGGRINKSQVEYSQKHPILLPKNHNLSRLIILDEHKRLLHAGPQATLASVRTKYWPINAKNLVKKVIHGCIICFRVNPRQNIPLMGELPTARVSVTRPFTTCGVDFAGPFLLKDGKFRNRKLIKAYLCIFVCFTTKACHLELAGDLSSESFLNALKRFVSRRGICKTIYSDNGTNFVGANNYLKEIQSLLSGMKSECNISNYLTNNSISWVFLPPRSPHFGGLHEAGVKSAKHHIKRIVGNAHLTYEELSTVFTQVEAVLNSRPITPISNDPNDLTALTPGHFLIGDSLNSLPQNDVRELPENRLKRYERLQQIVQHFWQRWSTEYLAQLQQRLKWQHKQSNNIVPGAMVVLKDPNAAPLNWPLARITAVHPGSDGVSRVVTVKCSGGTFKRAVTQICVLPIEEEQTVKT